jgi:hypothetical protein
MGGLVMLAAEGGYRSYDSSGPPGWFFGGFVVLWVALMVFSVAGYVFGIWSLVEILRYREDEFASVGLNRTTWLVLQIVGLALCQPLGAVAGIVFLWQKRPILRDWRAAHPVPPVPYVPYDPPPGYGPPPGAWYPPPPPVAPSDVWGGTQGPDGPPGGAR